MREILTRVAPLPRKMRADALVKLTALSGLRELDEVVYQEINRMPITVNLMENAVFRNLYRKGEAEGEAKGEARGEALGAKRGGIALLRRLLERKFGPLPEWVLQTLETADFDSLPVWGERVLNAQSLEEVFR